MPHLTVDDGTSLYVQDVGTGRPVVLLPGFGLPHEVWDAQVRLLAADKRIVAVDPRGTGCSAKPVGDYSLERLAADVESVVRQLDLRQVTLVGWSFGGQIALRVAASGRARLAQLVLVTSNGVRSTWSDGYPFGPDAQSLERALVAGEEQDRIGFRRRTITHGFAQEPPVDLVDWLVALQLRMPSWAAIACFRSMLHTDLTADLARLGLPVLQLAGNADPVTPVEGARWLHDRLPESRLVELPACGHYPMFEAPDEFNATLIDFVEEA